MVQDGRHKCAKKCGTQDPDEKTISEDEIFYSKVSFIERTFAFPFLLVIMPLLAYFVCQIIASLNCFRFLITFDPAH